MILPAKTPDGITMPNIARAFWPPPHPFFFKLKKTLYMMEMCRVTKKGKEFEGTLLEL